MIVIYNRLVSLRNRVSNALAQIDVQLKRRHDLIPNLVETARGYMVHERETLEAVVARTRCGAGGGKGGVAGSRRRAGDGRDGAGRRRLVLDARPVLALAEAYPDLKANENMMQLSAEITTSENELSLARQAFNDAVRQFNTALQSFPAVMFAGILGFKPAAMLAPLDSDIERKAPAVRF